MAKKRKIRIVRVIEPKIREIKSENKVSDGSELEKDVVESEEESFAHFLGSSKRTAPILNTTLTAQEGSVQPPVPTPRELNQPSSSEPTARLYDVGRRLGGNAPKQYETMEARSQTRQLKDSPLLERRPLVEMSTNMSKNLFSNNNVIERGNQSGQENLERKYQDTTIAKKDIRRRTEFY